MTQRVAVIGAGLAGLSCARVLRQAGCYVEVFEQDRVIGGRMATARLGLNTFDHGAQYMTARGERFRKFIEELEGEGYAARWKPRGSEGVAMSQMSNWYVGTPGMASIVRPLAQSIHIHTNRKVHTLQKGEKGGWELWFEDGSSEGTYHAVVIAVPANEARLLAGQFDRMAESIAKVRMSPCWAVLVRLDEEIFPNQDVFSDMSDVIRWIGRDNSKPGRKGKGEHVVIHASPSWSRETEDADPELVATEIWTEVSNLLKLPPARPSQMSAVLWRHGLVDQSLGETYLFDSEHMVGCVGDWCLGRLAEHAYESGFGLGRAMVAAM